MTRSRIQLESFLEDRAKKSPGSRLPTIKKLGECFSLSESTVKRALRPFLEIGCFESIAGKGTFVPEPKGKIQESQLESPRDSASQLAITLQNQIGDGRLRSGELIPSQTQLMQEFRVSHDTVKKACSILLSQGHVTSRGKRFTVGVSNILGDSKKTVVVLALSGHPFLDEYKSIWETVETELARYSIRLQIQCISMNDLPKWNSTSTLAWFLTGVNNSNQKKVLNWRNHIVKTKLHRQTPVFIYGEKLFNQASVPRNVTWLCRGTFVKDLARMIAEKLNQGQFKEIHVYYHVEKRLPGDFRFSIRLLSEIRKYSNNVPFFIHVIFPRQKLSVENFLQQDHTYRSAGYQYLLDIAGKFSPISLSELMSHCSVHGPNDVLFEASPRKSAWIFTDDSTAVKAKSFCKSQGIEVPNKVNILGIENSELSLTESISTCVTDWNRIAYLVTHALLGDIKIKRSSKGYMPTPYLYIRRETG